MPLNRFWIWQLFVDYKLKRMKLARQCALYQQRLKEEGQGCSLLKRSREEQHFFLAKKLVSPTRNQYSKQGQNLREERSPKHINSKISLKVHRQKMNKRIGFDIDSFPESIQQEEVFVSPKRHLKKNDCFSPARTSKINYHQNRNNSKAINIQKVKEMPNQHYSETTIKQLIFQKTASMPVISFVNPFTTNIHKQQQGNRNNLSPRLKIRISFQSMSVKEQLKSEEAEATVLPKTQRKTDLKLKQEQNLKSTTLSNFRLPPQLISFGDSSQLDIESQIPYEASECPQSPQKITQSYSNNTALRHVVQKQLISELSKSFGTARFGSPQFYKDLVKLRSIQKMQDVAEIVSVGDSNQSNIGDDQSIVLGRLQQFQPLRNLPKSQGAHYQKTLSECDSIVIFQ